MVADICDVTPDISTHEAGLGLVSPVTFCTNIEISLALNPEGTPDGVLLRYGNSGPKLNVTFLLVPSLQSSSSPFILV